MSIVLEGWTCLVCHVFNGESKERHLECRCCGREGGSVTRAVGEEKVQRATCRTCDQPRPDDPERNDTWVPQLGSCVTCPELPGWEGKIVQATLTVEWSDGQRNDWSADRLQPAPAVKKEGQR